MYGATFRKPKGYNKLELLGRGGCAVVWKCECQMTAKLYAVKQFPKCKQNEHNYKNVKDEIKINKIFFADRRWQNHPGLQSICRLIDCQENKYDIWLVFELGGQPLNNLLYNTKGKFYQGERIYEVKQDPLIFELLQKNNCLQFKVIVKKLV